MLHLLLLQLVLHYLQALMHKNLQNSQQHLLVLEVQLHLGFLVALVDLFHLLGLEVLLLLLALVHLVYLEHLVALEVLFLLLALEVQLHLGFLVVLVDLFHLLGLEGLLSSIVCKLN